MFIWLNGIKWAKKQHETFCKWTINHLTNGEHGGKWKAIVKRYWIHAERYITINDATTNKHERKRSEKSRKTQIEQNRYLTFVKLYSISESSTKTYRSSSLLCIVLKRKVNEITFYSLDLFTFSLRLVIRSGIRWYRDNQQMHKTSF